MCPMLRGSRGNGRHCFDVRAHDRPDTRLAGARTDLDDGDFPGPVSFPVRQSSCPVFRCQEMFPDSSAIDRQRMDRRPLDWRRDGAMARSEGEGLPPDRRQGRRHTPICGATPQRPLGPIKLNRRRHRTFLDEAHGGIRAVPFRPRLVAAFRSRVRVRPGRP